MAESQSRFLKVKLSGADDLINRIMEFKREKYGILRRAATKVAKPLVASVRQAYQRQTGIGQRNKKSEALTKALTRYRAVGQKSMQKTNQHVMLLNDHRAKIRKKRYQERFNKLGPIPVPGKAKRAPKAKRLKPKEHTLQEITRMVREEQNRRGWKFRFDQLNRLDEIRTNKKLLGNRRGMVQEVGQTSGLAKSIKFKISMAKAKRVAFDRETGQQLGGTGVKPSSNARGWQNPAWKTVSSNRVTMLIGATNRPVIAWNPFIKKLVKVDPKRYIHLVENGHIKKIRGVTRGAVKGRFTLGGVWRTKKASILAATKQALSEELAKVLAKQPDKPKTISAGGAK